MPRNKQQMPMCQYGASCTRKGCVYRHPPKPAKKAVKNVEICVHFIGGACSFGDKCANRHPGKAEAARFRETCASIACRFGAGCANAACLYNHDGRGRVPAARPAPAPAPPAAPPPAPAGDGWWQAPGALGERGDECCDPISLEPLGELGYPPFGLWESGKWHWFDGAVLATYLVSTATFANPLTRTPLAREDCRALDDYLNDHGLRASEKMESVLVTHAFDLLELTARGGGAEERAMVSRSQREATTVLRSLFGFARYEPPPEPPRFPDAPPPRAPAPYEDSFAPRPGGLGLGGGASLGDALAAAEGPRVPYGAAAAAPLDDVAEGDLDAGAFPALSALAALGLGDAPPPPPLGAPSFAAQAAKPAAPGAFEVPAYVEAPQSAGGGRRAVRVPREIWVPLRNARVFEVRDPIERYRLVAAAHDRGDVVDLHFQSNRTAPVVLDAVLDAALAGHPAGVWVVTGSGHHAPQRSHQKLHATLFHFTQDWLATRRYAFAVAKDHNGFAGAFLVTGLPPDRRAARFVRGAAGATWGPPPAAGGW